MNSKIGNDKKRRISVKRMIGLIFALLGIVFSIYCGRESSRLNKEFYQWEKDRPMDFPVDLSLPGQFIFPFKQTCSTSHGEAIFLELTPKIESDDEIKELFKSLSAIMVITDSQGKEVAIGPLEFLNSQRRDKRDDILLAHVFPFRKGNYSATLTVRSGVPQLQERKQAIYAEYLLCGLELMPAIIAGVFSFGAGFIAFILLILILPGLFLHGIWKFPPENFSAEEKLAGK